MSSTQSFVDLRTSSLNAGSHTDDSVWPSFTDIMTVVVMIFLMSLVVILLRNVELVKSEQQAAQLAEVKGIENVQLEKAINELEARIAQVQIQLQAQTVKSEQAQDELGQSQQQVDSLVADIQALQLLRDKLNDQNTELAAAKLALQGRLKIVEQDKSDIEALQQQEEQSNLVIEDEKQQLIIQLRAALNEKQQLEAQTEQQRTQMAELEKQKQSVLVQIQTLDKEKSQLSSQKQQATQEFNALNAVHGLLQKDNRSLADRISDAEKLVAELEQNLTEADDTIIAQQQKLVIATDEIETKTQQLTQAEVQFIELEQKYLDLVGPARSELDKYVVTVRYRRVGNQTVIEFADPAGSTLSRVSEAQLHQRLQKLKQQKGNELYTRVVIPAGSGLSYDQAWRFTQDILTQYDYYYQNDE